MSFLQVKTKAGRSLVINTDRIEKVVQVWQPCDANDPAAEEFPPDKDGGRTRYSKPVPELSKLLFDKTSDLTVRVPFVYIARFLNTGEWPQP